MPDAAETKAKNENVNAYFINGYCLTLSVTLYIIINKINIILEYQTFIKRSFKRGTMMFNYLSRF